MAMEKKNIDWANLGFGYVQTDKRYVSNYKNGAWDEGGLTDDATVTSGYRSDAAGGLRPGSAGGYAGSLLPALSASSGEKGRGCGICADQ